jgi:hypothetical protein
MTLLARSAGTVTSRLADYKLTMLGCTVTGATGGGWLIIMTLHVASPGLPRMARAVLMGRLGSTTVQLVSDKIVITA